VMGPTARVRFLGFESLTGSPLRAEESADPDYTFTLSTLLDSGGCRTFVPWRHGG
jgi:hypothetical protein